MLRDLFFRVYKCAATLAFGRTLERYYPAHPLHRRLLASIRPDVTNVRGHTMYLDAVDSLLLSMRGIYEPTQTAIVERLVRPGDTVLDLGANIGYYTLQFAKLAGKTGHVIAFEPDPISFAILQKNIEANGYTSVTLVQRAVSNTAGILRLYCSALNRGDNRIFNSYDGRPSVYVEVVRLDDHLRDLDHVNLIKMDIQGAEGAALEGMIALVERSPEVKIFSEFWPQGMLACGTHPTAYLDILTRMGFGLYEISDETGRLESTTADALLARNSLATGSETNLLCSRQPLLV